VIEVEDEKTGELVYCVRIKGNEFNPKIFAQSSYKITVKDTEGEVDKVFEGVMPIKNSDEKLLVVF
jgi:hypothetical protein